MRTFYLFKIKKEFINLYKDNYKILYDSLRRIYSMDKKEVQYGYNLLFQLIDIINKDDIDRHLFVKLHNKMFYTKQDNDHIINNLYKDEISILKIKNIYMRLEVNKDYSMFFDILYNKHDNYFICDFINDDYFFLRDVKVLV